ncbi:MAG: thioredoxin [Bacteroidetes bacterium]|nr:thioredoxin [Bacteroidota bacterium]
MLDEKTLPKSFEELVNTSEVPVFVDFWAEWCGPCRMVAPAVKQLSEEFDGRLLVVKINVDNKPELAQKYGVSGIPAFGLYHKGKTLHQFVGAMPYAMLKQNVEKYLPTKETEVIDAN